MSHRARLAAFDPATRTLSAPELEANSYVPLFWLAMFEPDDLSPSSDQELLFEGREPSPGPHDIGPYLVTDAGLAIQRLSRRTPALVRICGAAHEALLEHFLGFIRKNIKASVIVRLDDLAFVVGREPYVAKARVALDTAMTLDAAVASPHAAKVFKEFCGLDATWKKSKHAPMILAGSGDDWPSRPSGNARVKREEARTMREQRERGERWILATADKPRDAYKPYAASATFAEGDLVHHPKFGDGVVVRTVDTTKVEVLFQDAARILVHAAAAPVQ
jgi:hypothetical protein